MRFALYHPWVYLTSGIERSFVELLDRSRHDWIIYTHHHSPETTYPELRAHEVVELTPRVSVQRSFGPLAKAAATIATARLPNDGWRGLLVSSEGLGDLILARNRVPGVLYCHTPLKILFDPVNRAILARRRPRQANALKVLGPPFAAVDRAMWRRAAHAFANSEETRRRIVAGGLADVDDVEVLHPGVDVDRFTPAPAAEHAAAPGAPAGEPLFLVAGRIMWQKNVELAIDALGRAREQGSHARLVVAGAVDEKSRAYIAELRARADGLPVSFEADPPDARLLELYRTCLALVYPPRNEDFGIVPLEAMACGAPVLAVDAGGPRETVVDGRTGWLLPADAAAFAARMLAIERDQDGLDDVRAAARERARAFGWDAFAARIDDVMEEVATRTT